MLRLLQEKIASGPFEASIMAIGGNTQVSYKVMIEEVDAVGMVCRVKGMMGGWSESQVRPWACVSHVIFV